MQDRLEGWVVMGNAHEVSSMESSAKMVSGDMPVEATLRSRGSGLLRWDSTVYEKFGLDLTVRKLQNRVRSAPLLKLFFEEAGSVPVSKEAPDWMLTYPNETPGSSVTTEESIDEEENSIMHVKGEETSNPCVDGPEEVMLEETDCEDDDQTQNGLDRGITLTERMRELGEGLEVHTFAAATEASIICIIDAILQGMMPAHGLTRRDIRGNLKKIVEVCEKSNQTNIEGMIEEEIASGVRLQSSGREAVLWLKRSLQFICIAVNIFVQAERNGEDIPLVRIVKDSYNRTLAGVHGFKAHAFRLFLNGIPNSSVFVGRLGDDRMEVVDLLEEWYMCYAPVIAELTRITNEFDLERCRRMQSFDEKL